MNIKLVEPLKKICDDKCDSLSITNGATTHGGFSACSGCLEEFLRDQEKLINEQIAREYIKMPDYEEALAKIKDLLCRDVFYTDEVAESHAAEEILKTLGITPKASTVKGGGG